MGGRLGWRLLAALLALLARPAALAAPAGPGKGLDESTPCCRICPSMFYGLKPTPWLPEGESAMLEVQAEPSSEAISDQARDEAAAAWFRQQQKRAPGARPGTVRMSSFLEEAARLNAHKQIEKICCNVCREEYDRDLEYPEILTSYGGPTGRDRTGDDSPAPGFRFAENPQVTNEQELAQAAMSTVWNAQAAARSKQVIDSSPQMRKNRDLAPCCYMCPTGCPPVYVDDRDLHHYRSTEAERKPQDPPVGAFEISPDEKQRREREEARQAGWNVKDCCARKEPIDPYIAAPGDKYPDLATHFCTTFADIQAANPEGVVVSPDHLAPGTRLVIPKPNCSGDVQNAVPRFREARGGPRGPLPTLEEAAAALASASAPAPAPAAAAAGGSLLEADSAEQDAHRRRFIGNLLKKGAQVVGNVVNKAKEVVGHVVNKAKEVVGHVVNKVKEVAKKVATHVGNAVRAVGGAINRVVQAVVKNPVVSAVFSHPLVQSIVQHPAVKSMTDTLKSFWQGVKVLPVKIAPPGERYFQDKTDVTTAFDPPGTHPGEDRCRAKVLLNCCHVCYSTWPEDHPRHEALRRRKEARLRAALEAKRKAFRTNGGAEEVDVESAPYLQNPWLLQGGKQEAEIRQEAKEAQDRQIADLNRQEAIQSGVDPASALAAVGSQPGTNAGETLQSLARQLLG